MKIAVVDWDITYPTNSGKRLRTLNLMIQLAKRHELHYVSRGDSKSPEAFAAKEFLGDHAIQSHFLSHPIPKKSGAGYAYRILANATTSSLPYAVAAHQGTAFQRDFAKFARQHAFDVWQLEWTPYSTMLAGVSPAPRVIVAHNVDSLIWQRYYETESRPLHKAYIRRQMNRFLSFEQHAFSSASRVVAVSEPDAKLMREMFGIDHVDVVDNGVDVERYGNMQRRPQNGEILFLGSLDWRPNQDALRLLISEVMPRVLAKQPAAKLVIVGRNPPGWLSQQAAGSPSIELHANVPDVQPYLETASLMAIPLRIGGGSRLKMIEALAARVPVVATTIAAEGLCVCGGEHYAVADTVESMAEKIVHWLRNPQFAADCANIGQQLVADHYGWDRLAGLLETSLQRACETNMKCSLKPESVGTNLC